MMMFQTKTKAIVRKGRMRTSKALQTLAKGTIVEVTDVRLDRAFIVKPISGWVSVRTKRGTLILGAPGSWEYEQDAIREGEEPGGTTDGSAEARDRASSGASGLVDTSEPTSEVDEVEIQLAEPTTTYTEPTTEVDHQSHLSALDTPISSKSTPGPPSSPRTATETEWSTSPRTLTPDTKRTFEERLAAELEASPRMKAPFNESGETRLAERWAQTNSVEPPGDNHLTPLNHLSRSRRGSEPTDPIVRNRTPDGPMPTTPIDDIAAPLGGRPTGSLDLDGGLIAGEPVVIELPGQQWTYSAKNDADQDEIQSIEGETPLTGRDPSKLSDDSHEQCDRVSVLTEDTSLAGDSADEAPPPSPSSLEASDESVLTPSEEAPVTPVTPVTEQAQGLLDKLLSIHAHADTPAEPTASDVSPIAEVAAPASRARRIDVSTIPRTYSPIEEDARYGQSMRDRVGEAAPAGAPERPPALEVPVKDARYRVSRDNRMRRPAARRDPPSDAPNRQLSSPLVSKLIQIESNAQEEHMRQLFDALATQQRALSRKTQLQDSLSQLSARQESIRSTISKIGEFADVSQTLQKARVRRARIRSTLHWHRKFKAITANDPEEWDYNLVGNVVRILKELKRELQMSAEHPIDDDELEAFMASIQKELVPISTKISGIEKERSTYVAFLRNRGCDIDSLQSGADTPLSKADVVRAVVDIIGPGSLFFSKDSEGKVAQIRPELRVNWGYGPTSQVSASQVEKVVSQRDVSGVLSDFTQQLKHVTYQRDALLQDLTSASKRVSSGDGQIQSLTETVKKERREVMAYCERSKQSKQELLRQTSEELQNVLLQLKFKKVCGQVQTYCASGRMDEVEVLLKTLQAVKSRLLVSSAKDVDVDTLQRRASEVRAEKLRLEREIEELDSRLQYVNNFMYEGPESAAV